MSLDPDAPPGPVLVRLTAAGAPAQLRQPEGWVQVVQVLDRWVVETGWWRTALRAPTRRTTWRVLLAGDRCCELTETGGRWTLTRPWG